MLFTIVSKCLISLCQTVDHIRYICSLLQINLEINVDWSLSKSMCQESIGDAIFLVFRRDLKVVCFRRSSGERFHGDCSPTPPSRTCQHPPPPATHSCVHHDNNKYSIHWRITVGSTSMIWAHPDMFLDEESLKRRCANSTDRQTDTLPVANCERSIFQPPYD